MNLFPKLYGKKIPPHLDKGWYMFFVSLYLHIYWVLGAAMGNLFGTVLPFNLKGVEFSMTALFLVIFCRKLVKRKIPRKLSIRFRDRISFFYLL